MRKNVFITQVARLFGTKRGISRGIIMMAVAAGVAMLCDGCVYWPAKRMESASATVAAVASPEISAKVQPQAKDVLAFDDFDGKLNLPWAILNADPSHYSLTKTPGALTITTQSGGFALADSKHKNVFLIDCPAADGKALQATICVLDFKPQGDYNQVGLVFWNDDNNYIKWDCEWAARRTLMVIGETDGKYPFQTPHDAPPDSDKLWLRLTKSGTRYALYASPDGKEFKQYPFVSWGDGIVKKVGFYAMNGRDSKAPEIDAAVDFFELKLVTAPTEAP